MEIMHARCGREDIVFVAGGDDEVRANCLAPFKGNANGCPNFGKSWSCPPHAITVQEMMERLEGFSDFHAIFVESRLPVPAGLEPAEMEALKRDYFFMSLELGAFLSYIREKVPGCLVLSSPRCQYCPDHGFGPCTCPDAPCRFPDRLTYPPEAVGIDIFQTMKRVGVDMEVNPSTVVRRVAIGCFPRKVDLDSLLRDYRRELEE